MKKGDKVWRYCDFGELEPIEYSISEEIFDGWFSLDKKRISAILKCDYDGGFEVLVSNIFPTKEEAKLAAIPRIIKRINDEQKSLFKRNCKLEKQKEKLQKLLK